MAARILGKDRCAIVGGMAVNAHGYVRATRDVDVMTKMPLTEAREFLRKRGIETKLFRGDPLDGRFRCLKGVIGLGPRRVDGVPFDVIPPLVRTLSCHDSGVSPRAASLRTSGAKRRHWNQEGDRARARRRRNEGHLREGRCPVGKRLRKADLLREIEIEQNALDMLLADLLPAEMTVPGLTEAGWSVKDVLAHLADWQERNLQWYEAGLRGETPVLPAPGFTWRETPRLNAAIFEKHRRRSLKAVLLYSRAMRDEIMGIIARVSDADLVTLGRFPWTGPSWTLSDYLRANTASHYRWARKLIRRWRRERPAAARRPRRRRG